jgi:hypothetical protein
MRTRIALLVVVLAAVAGLVLIAPVTAQDETMTHTCDSTTILLLYLAEHDYGFHSMMDVSTFEKGQYAPLFDAMMAMMEEEMMATEEAMMEEEMATEEAMMEGEMMMLAPAIIADEDPACTALRAEVEAHLYSTLSADMIMEESGG